MILRPSRDASNARRQRRSAAQASTVGARTHLGQLRRIPRTDVTRAQFIETFQSSHPQRIQCGGEGAVRAVIRSEGQASPSSTQEASGVSGT